MNRLHRIIAGSALTMAMAGGVTFVAMAEKETPPPPRAQQSDDANAPQNRREWRPQEDGQGGMRGEGRGGMRSGGPMPLLRGIDLTPEQRDQLKQIMQESRSKREAWNDEHKDEVDAAKAEVEKAREALRKAEEKMRDLMDGAPGGPKDMAEKVKSILTDEQKAQLEENIEQMKQQGPPPPAGDMMGGRGGPDGERPQMNWRRDGGDRPEGERPRRRQGEQPPQE